MSNELYYSGKKIPSHQCPAINKMQSRIKDVLDDMKSCPEQHKTAEMEDAEELLDDISSFLDDLRSNFDEMRHVCHEVDEMYNIQVKIAEEFESANNELSNLVDELK